MWPAWRDVYKKGSNLFSQVQELGLQVAYTEDQGTYGWIRKLLALPFLPYTEITTQFERLRLGAEGPRSVGIDSITVDLQYHIPREELVCLHAARPNKQ